MKTYCGRIISHLTLLVFPVLLPILITGCASPPRIVSDHIPSGSLRLTQVIYLASRRSVEDPGFFKLINQCGIKDSDVHDGSFALGQVFCCGGPNVETSATTFYIPPTLPVKMGDYVVVRIGTSPKNGRGEVNTAIEVRGNANDPNCPIRWIPPQENLWRRILYADWMPAEGWVYQGGLWKTWCKPAAMEGR